jgi:hypothetical protein
VLAIRDYLADCIRSGQRDIWIKGHHRLSSEAIGRVGDTVVSWGSTSQKTLLKIPSGYRLIGDGPSDSSLVVEGAASVTLLSIVDASSVAVEGLSFVGNSQESTATFPGAIHVLATPKATHEQCDYSFLDLRFENFKNASWSTVHNLSFEKLTGITIKRNSARSSPGNLRAPASIGAENDAWSFSGNIIDPRGLVTDIDIQDFAVEGSWLKSAVAFWSCVRTARVNRLQADNIGKYSTDDAGAYAVKLYSNHWYVNPPELWHDRRFFPDNVDITNSFFSNARSAGVYFASAGRLTVTDSVFKGQNDRHNLIEPRGCIAGPSGVEFICDGNIIDDAFVGIDWFPEPEIDCRALIRNNCVTNIKDDGIGIKVRTTLDHKPNGRVTIADNYSSGTEPGSRGLLVQYSDEYRFSDVEITSNVLRGNYADAEILYDGTEQPVKLTGNSLLTSNFKRTNMATWHR